MNEEVYQYKYPENDNDGKKNKKEEMLAKEKEEDAKLEAIGEDTNNVSVAEKVEDLEEKKNKKVIIILAVIFFFIILVLLTIFFIVPKVSNGKAVTIPDCKNLKVTACEKKLQKAGFEVNAKIKSIASSDIEKNRVVKTDPSKGRSVKKGTKITIYKSKGEEIIKLEDYVGKNAIEIKTLLETKYELVVTIEKKEPSDKSKEYDDDEIIGQSLAAGSEVKKGDSLTLYTPNIVEKIPDMVEEKWSLSDVEAFCNRYGLNLETKEEETNAYPEGTIISQNLPKNRDIVKGMTLRVTVAVKPKAKPTPQPTPTPDVASENDNKDNTQNSKDDEADKDKEGN